ncbi:preprotein translocase subunit YajC [Aeromicrobium sp.]|uniref:preprotein translocase subunit YajC n=1 Tax=Aeromicrobium sp. TaxID=1871063 RepID=UPI0019A6E4C2|nr:preprotein translocase subunit YajC [Aeromicrobium sp.]MBC7630680.1 preprotein translocase subunit YajC [Aeromicrobium sp.]
MDNLGALLPLVILVIAFILLVVRPARARQRAFLKTQGELAVGNKVMMASGMFGEIVSIGDDTLELRIAPQTVVTINRQAVARVVPDAVEPGAPQAGIDLEKGPDA